jgi:3',5'-cyclic AMP phosphodiesterase CpdA
VVFYRAVHARGGRAVTAALPRAAAAIAAQRADLIVCGGDAVEAGVGTTGERAARLWNTYATAMLGPIGRDVRHAVGNHDLVGTSANADVRAAARTALGLERTYYSFEVGAYHFVVLDSVAVDSHGEYTGHVGAEQLAWLRSDLAATPRSARVVVVTHMPLCTGFFGSTEPGTGPADRVVRNAADVLDVLSMRRLILVLQGHLHVYEALEREGVAFLSGGAVSGRWWKGVYLDTPPGFAVVALDGDEVASRYVGYA